MVIGMKLTQPQKVMHILRPPIFGMSPTPAVNLADPLSRAVELMLENDMTEITVISGGRAIGHIQLADALDYLGLQRPV